MVADIEVIFLKPNYIDMKRLLILILFIGSMSNAIAQHYGGFTFTPYAVENNHSFSKYGAWSSNVKGNKLTFGYSLGYQGLLMPQRRFSFSYGLQYGRSYNEAQYDPPIYDYSDDRQIVSTTLGNRIDIESIEMPLWWRYNILKNRKKFQPFIAVSTTVVYNLKAQRTTYYLDSPDRVYDFDEGIGLNLDLGIGINYYTDNWLFTVQPTYSHNYLRKLGIGFSVMRKF